MSHLVLIFDGFGLKFFVELAYQRPAQQILVFPFVLQRLHVDEGVFLGQFADLIVAVLA